MIASVQLFKIIKLKNTRALMISLISMLFLFLGCGYFESKINKESFFKAYLHGVYPDFKKDGFTSSNQEAGRRKHIITENIILEIKIH